MIFKIDIKMNLSRKSKINAANPKKGIPTKSFLQPFGLLSLFDSVGVALYFDITMRIIK